MTTTYVNNIASVLDSAPPRHITAGMYWYLNANKLAHELTPGDPAAGAAIIAVLSPRLRWEKNVRYAWLAINLAGYGTDSVVQSYVPALNNSRRKALAIVNGADPIASIGRGPKTNAFFDNILNPFTSMEVTVDKHAFDIANNLRMPYKGQVITNKAYREIAEAYTIVAGMRGMLPHQVQAITWCHWREMVGAK